MIKLEQFNINWHEWLFGFSWGNGAVLIYFGPAHWLIFYQ